METWVGRMVWPGSMGVDRQDGCGQAGGVWLGRMGVDRQDGCG